MRNELIDTTMDHFRGRCPRLQRQLPSCNNRPSNLPLEPFISSKRSPCLGRSHGRWALPGVRGSEYRRKRSADLRLWKNLYNSSEKYIAFANIPGSLSSITISLSCCRVLSILKESMVSLSHWPLCVLILQYQHFLRCLSIQTLQLMCD
jgi:hypothetical protein